MADETHHVVMHTPEEDGENGFANIIRAFIRNPGAAVQICMIVVGGTGVYYALEGEVREVRSAQMSNFEKLNAKLDIMIARDQEQSLQIKDLYARGDVRYQQLLSKLSESDVTNATLKAGVDYLVKQFDGKGVAR